MDELDPGERLYLDRLSEEYRRRHGVGVAELKQQVGPGDEYVNAAGRIVISARGAWFECLDQPMEFSGIAGVETPYHLADCHQTLSTLDHLYSLSADEQATPAPFRLFVLYSRRGIVDGSGVYVSEAAGRVIGRFRQGELPLLFRCRYQLTSPPPGLTISRGVVACLCGVGDGNLVVEMPYDSPNLHSLALPPHPVTQ